MTPDEAFIIFEKEAGGDPQKYKLLYDKYTASLRALKVLNEIKENLKVSVTK